MKLMETIKNDKTKIHLLAILMYVLGVICDAYGYLSNYLEYLVSLPLLLASIVFSISISCSWFNNNIKYLKSATIHLFTLLIGAASLFFYGFWSMWPSFVLTLIYLLFVIILFIMDLIDVYSVYSKIVRRENR